MLLLLVAPRSQHDHSKCFCFSLHQDVDSFRIEEDFHGIAPKSLERLILCSPFSNVFVMLLLPAPQDNNKNKLAAGREFSLLILLSGSILSDFLRQFSSSFFANQSHLTIIRNQVILAAFFLPHQHRNSHARQKLAPPCQGRADFREIRGNFSPFQKLIPFALRQLNSRTRQRNCVNLLLFHFLPLHCKLHTRVEVTRK